MKTKKEIKEEIAELYGAAQALGEAILLLNKQHQETTKKYFAMCHMLKDMVEDKDD
jgi:hypothetical protein